MCRKGVTNTDINNLDMVTWQLTSDGQLDIDPITGFGIDPANSATNLGYITYHNAAGGALVDMAHGIAVTTNNKIVAVGNSTGITGNGGDLVVWQYIGTQ